MLKVDRQGRCAVWTIVRPEAQNALNIETLDHLLLAAEAAGRDGGLRAVVLTGEGKSFCSGGDLRELRTMTSAADAARFADVGAEVCRRIEELDLPVLAAVNGPALGGGAELALACDMRLADARARFAFKQVRMGVTTAWGSIHRLSGLVGAGSAMRLLTTAHEVSAAEAKICGLVDEVTADGTCVATALAWAYDIEQGSARAVGEMKALLRAARAANDVRQLERERFVATWTAPDHAEAMDAYFGRRQPNWVPRG